MRKHWAKLTTATLALVAVCAGARAQDLHQQFLNPPDDAKPMVRWWWFGPAVTAEEIRKEIDQMHAGGIGGFEIASVYPLAVDQIKAQGQRLPGDIKPDDWDGFHDLIVIDEVARCGYLGVIWALTCGNSIGAPPLVNFGTKELKDKFLPDVLSGRSRFCLGITEPDGTYTFSTRKGVY